MKASDRYKMVRADYERLVELHGEEDVEDFTGGFVFEKHAMGLMRNPTKACAADIYEDLIRYAAVAGFCSARSIDYGVIRRVPEVVEIFSKYGYETSDNLSEY
jgi:hypothetical protein